MSRTRYSSDWKQIATAVKNASDWRCTKCGRICLRPGDKPDGWSKSQLKAYNLQVHHYNFNPSDNRLSNLAPLCSGCHLNYHQFRRGNISPGQLSLF